MVSGVGGALLEECVECARLTLALDEKRGHVRFTLLSLLLLLLTASFSCSFRTRSWCWRRRGVARRRRWRWSRWLRAGAAGWCRWRRRRSGCGWCGEKCRELCGRRGEQRVETLEHTAAEAVTHLRTENARSAYESEARVRLVVLAEHKARAALEATRERSRSSSPVIHAAARTRTRALIDLKREWSTQDQYWGGRGRHEITRTFIVPVPTARGMTRLKTKD